MKTGVLLVNWNSPEETIACVDSLYCGVRTPEWILVWDNGSRDPSCGGIRDRFPSVELIAHLRNEGFAEANNCGAEQLIEMGADAVWILNNDTRVEPDCLDELVRYLESRPEVAAVSGRILTDTPPGTIWYAGGKFRGPALEPVHLGMGCPDSDYVDTSGQVSFLSGCCILARSKVIREHGLFNPAFFAYLEDAEWCWRMEKAGLPLHYVPSARLVHVGSTSVQKNQSCGYGGVTPLQHYLLARNKFWFLRQAYRGNVFGGGVAAVLHLTRMAWYALATLLRGRPAKTLAILRGVRDGLVSKSKGVS